MSRMIQIAEYRYVNKNDIVSIRYEPDYTRGENPKGEPTILVSIRGEISKDTGFEWYQEVAITERDIKRPMNTLEFIAFLNELNQ